VFSAAVEGDAAPLAVAGVVGSAVAVFFYIRIVVLLFFTDPPAAPEHGQGHGQGHGVGHSATAAAPAHGHGHGHSRVAVVRPEGLTSVAIGLAALATVALGVLPSSVLDLVGEAARFIP
jgi:NADH-quinone oxidoreductase subunit N